MEGRGLDESRTGRPVITTVMNVTMDMKNEETNSGREDTIFLARIGPTEHQISREGQGRCHLGTNHVM